MDLLASLNIPTLPEQQTRTSHNAQIAAVLSSRPNVRLGFDACCTCGSSSAKLISCKRCKRVSYCSEKCLKEDADASRRFDDDDDPAQGHSAVVCSLLRLCNDDEDHEERTERKRRRPSFSRTTTTTKRGPRNDDGDDDGDAEFRVRSERESYPATLANVLTNESCFRSALRGSRLGDDDRRTLSVHVVGASAEAELWGGHRDEAFDAYAEAFAESSGTPSTTIPATIDVVFVGPQCPRENRVARRSVAVGGGGDGDGASSLKRTTTVRLRTFRSVYDRTFFDDAKSKDVPPPDVVAFFNPGFTCQDYSWDETLSFLSSEKRTRPLPFLVTTNTEMEAVMDCQYLLERGCVPELPTVIERMLRIEEEEEGDEGYDDNDDQNSMFYCENPYAGSRVRQSGNMANDLFVKSRFVFGGCFSSAGKSPREKSTKKRCTDDDDENDTSAKKHKTSGKHQKKKNAALI